MSGSSCAVQETGMSRRLIVPSADDYRIAEKNGSVIRFLGENGERLFVFSQKADEVGLF